MQRTSPVSIPRWAPAAAAIGLVVWAVSIWWMVATLPTGGDTSVVEEGLSLIADQMEAARGEVDALAAEVETLRSERDALAERIEALEARPALDSAFPLSSSPDTAEPASNAGTATIEGDAGATASTPVATHPLFTNGADRYNCSHFASYAEAQDALRVNRPGDPNRIDMNNNGIACEDVRFPTPRATATPPAATPRPATTP